MFPKVQIIPKSAKCTNRGVFNLPHNQHSIDDPAEDHMLAIKEVALGGGDEELAPIGVLPAVGHREQARLVVLQLKILIGKCGTSVDGHATRAVSIHKVAPLRHDLEETVFLSIDSSLSFAFCLSVCVQPVS